MKTKRTARKSCRRLEEEEKDLSPRSITPSQPKKMKTQEETSTASSDDHSSRTDEKQIIELPVYQEMQESVLLEEEEEEDKDSSPRSIIRSLPKKFTTARSNDLQKGVPLLVDQEIQELVSDEDEDDEDEDEDEDEDDEDEDDDDEEERKEGQYCIVENLLLWESKPCVLDMTVIRGRDFDRQVGEIDMGLRAYCWEYFVVAWVAPGIVRSTKFATGLHPTWNETFVLPVDEPVIDGNQESYVFVEVVRNRTVERDGTSSGQRVVGRGVTEMPKYVSAWMTEHTLDLLRPMRKGVAVEVEGSLQIRMRLRKKNKNSHPPQPFIPVALATPPPPATEAIAAPPPPPVPVPVPVPAPVAVAIPLPPSPAVTVAVAPPAMSRQITS